MVIMSIGAREGLHFALYRSDVAAEFHERGNEIDSSEHIEVLVALRVW